MSSISEGMKGVFNTSIRTLNQPLVKEGIKNIFGTVTCVFGLIEVYDVYQILRGREITTESYIGYPKWIQVANKVIIVCAKISLILSAGVSRPGVFILSSLIGGVFSTSQLNRVFGPNTIFAVNPWHPRHVVSIAATILALPCFVQSVYKGVSWTCRKIKTINTQNNTPGLIDAKIRFMILFNTVTGRPVLHIGNQLIRCI